MNRLSGRYLNSLGRRIGLPLPATRAAIKAARVASHLPDWLRRRRMAERLRPSVAVKRSEGYRLLPAGRLPAVGPALAECRAAYAAAADTIEASVGNHTYFRFFARDGAPQAVGGVDGDEVCDYRAAPGLMALALDPEILAAASRYLGEVPVLGNVNFYVSLPNDRRQGAQLYHWDKGDHRQFKAIFLIGDCGEEDGPFTFLPAGPTARVKAGLGRRSGGRMADEEVFRFADTGEQVRLLGPSGTGVMIDTAACLHFGSRNPRAPRKVLMLQYMSRAMILEPAFARSKVRHNLKPADLDKVQRLAAALIL